MKPFAFIVLIFLVWSVPAAKAYADLTLDLATDHVDINTGFNGADIKVYGHTDRAGDIIIVVSGPQNDMVVRKKNRIFGMWVNRESFRFKNVYGYYDYAATDNIENILEESLLSNHRIGLDYLDFQPSKEAVNDRDKINRFHESLIRIKQSEALYTLKGQDIFRMNNTFFKASFRLPPNVPTGQYSIHGYVVANDRIVEDDRIMLRVAQVGKSAEIYKFAHNQSLLYGIAAAFIAVILGLLANAVLRRD